MPLQRLFGYISGSNANQTKIPMTAPVLTGVHPATQHFERSNYTVAFFLPYEVTGQTVPPGAAVLAFALIPKHSDRMQPPRCC